MSLNLPGNFLSVFTIQILLDKDERKIKDGKFRFDIVRCCLSLSNTKIVFCFEHCTEIIPKATYDTSLNSFVNFSLPLEEGCSIIDYYQTESLTQLGNWLFTVDM